jgi:alkylation response protein AidB-like acyl-CoA dehydrogenase
MKRCPSSVSILSIHFGSLAPRRVEGGLVISGKWYFSSGSLHAQWAILGCVRARRERDVGIGRAALKYVIEKAPQQAIAYTLFTRKTDSTVFQVQVAQAALRIDSAHLRAFHAADDIDDLARRNESPSYITRARVRADTGVVASDITDALNTLIFAHGAGSFAEASPMQRW